MIENHSKFWVCLRRNFLFTPKTFGRLSTADQSHVMSVASDPAPSGWKSHLRGLSPFLSFPKAFPLAQGQFLSPHCVASALHRQPPAHWTSPIPKPRRDRSYRLISVCLISFCFLTLKTLPECSTQVHKLGRLFLFICFAYFATQSPTYFKWNIVFP